MSVSAPLYATPRLATAEIAGRRQAWRERGAGNGGRLPLVLLHGIGSNARVWAGQFAGLASERRVVAWNAPGYLGSDALASARPVAADYATAALAWIDYLGIDRFVLVGQSLGAVMATGMATMAPGRVAALALISPATGYATPGDAPLPEKAVQRIEDIRRFGPAGLASRRADRLLSPSAPIAARRIVRKAMAELVPAGYEQAVALLAGANLLRDVAKWRGPTLVAWGAADVVTPPASCASVAAACVCAKRIEIADAGHAVATEAPAEINRALALLSAVADAGGKG